MCPPEQLGLFKAFEPSAAPLARPLPMRRGGVEYRALPCRSVLNWVDGTRASGFFSINPYRGCEFDCAYCYARYTHEFLEPEAPGRFDRSVFVKTGVERALLRDLRSPRAWRHKLSFGSATDPYQPGERIFRNTRAMLEALLPLKGLSLGIVTKSALISRDAELLRELNLRHHVQVLFSCITVDRHLQRSLEPRAPTPDVRLAAMARLSAAGISCALMAAPMLPGITDSSENLNTLCRRAWEAGARSVHSQVLFLPEASRPRFWGWLREMRPDLVDRYQAAFERTRDFDPRYQEGLERRLAHARRAAGFR